MKKKLNFLFILIILIILVFVFNGIVVGTAKNRIISMDDLKNLKDIDAILVLGCKVNPAGPSLMLDKRLEKGVEVYNTIGTKLLLSGDHGQEEYDEVNTMKEYIIGQDINLDDVFLDHAGFSTYDSIYRAKNIFGIKKMIIVSQRYHLFRALYIANSLNINADGVNSDPRSYVGRTFREIREVMARNKDFFKCIVKPKSKYLGDAIPVNGDGNITNDK